MSKIIQARIDSKTASILKKLKAMGWQDSYIVREGIRLLGLTALRPQKNKIVGMGKFSSNVSDLASNKKHLKGFGK